METGSPYRVCRIQGVAEIIQVKHLVAGKHSLMKKGQRVPRHGALTLSSSQVEVLCFPCSLQTVLIRDH